MVALALLACTPESPLSVVDVSERLGPDESRAGVIGSESALFGGISAEGRPGDVKIYNDRVQFVIQAARDGDYYVSQGGGVVDADLVRPEGQLGRDAVDEWNGMYGLGRIVRPDAVEIVSDGGEGPAIVRVTGRESPMALIEGAVGGSIIPDLGLEMTVEYTLEPGSWLLEVRTEITATADAAVQPGDILFGALEAVQPWDPGVGLDTPGKERAWTGLVGFDDDVAYAIAAEPGQTLSPGASDLLSGLVQLSLGNGPAATLVAGESTTYTRYYGVGPDLATITDALLAGTDTDAVEGTVTAADGPVAGARVNVLVDDAPYTLAITDAEGKYHARIPTGKKYLAIADGRGSGLSLDLPDGYTHYGPYAAPSVCAATLDAFEQGAAAWPHAVGRGVGTSESPTTLGVPGWLVVTADDGLPFEARVQFQAADAEVDRRLFRDRPSGSAAIAWARDGEVRIPVEPGTYTLVAHRGVRYELDQRTVEVEPGEELPIAVHLPKAYETPGYLLGDPHMHASPSGDVTIPMEDRLIVAAALGLQLHFGTDHDHIADYRPLLGPLGLDGVLDSVVADEVSPVLRGHTNIYPVESVPSKPNKGAFRWWEEPVASTQAQYDRLRERHGDFVLQINHPTGQGLATSAGWSPGVIHDADKWSTDFDAVEVENAGEVGDYLRFYWDVLLRGVIATPTGVSDSHGRTGSSQGASATFIGMGTDDPTAYTDAALRDAMRARRTVVTRGPFLKVDVDPGSTVGPGTVVTAEALSPSWIRVDRLILVRDGAPVETVQGTKATFILSPEKDAAYAIVAEGDSGMGPIYGGTTPWAMTSPYLVDVGSDGWEPPLGPFTVR